MGLRDFLPENFLLGTSSDKRPLSFNPELADLIVENFNCITVANNMKRRRVCPLPDRIDLDPIDWMVNFCRSHNIVLRGHGLLTRNDNSFFLQSLPIEEVKAHWENYVTQIFTRYRGLIPFYDVAIEQVGNDGSLLGNFWTNKLGANHVHKTFALAHEADPDAKLFYCDYGLHNNIKSAGVFNLINSIRSAGAPVHGLAIQIHHNISGVVKLLWLRRLIRQAKAEDLIVHISEVTIWGNPGLPETTTEIAQSHIYAKLLDICFDEGVDFFNCWSSCDRFAWRHPERTPGWWDEDYQPKKAVREIERTLQKNFKPSPSQ